MLTGAFIFLIIAVIAGYLGYKKTEQTVTRNARMIFYISSVLFLILLTLYFMQPAPPPPAVPINPLQ